MEHIGLFTVTDLHGFAETAKRAHPSARLTQFRFNLDDFDINFVIVPSSILLRMSLE
jgi:hypothetical protein